MRLFGGLFMVFGILLGALGSHYFKRILSVEALESFEVGLRYLIYHGLALLLLSGISFKSPKEKKRIFYFDIVGDSYFFRQYILAFF